MNSPRQMNEKKRKRPVVGFRNILTHTSLRRRAIKILIVAQIEKALYSVSQKVKPQACMSYM